MRRLVAKRVFSGLTTAWRLAEMPTNRSPSFVKATTEGVVRPPDASQRIASTRLVLIGAIPSEFSIIRGWLPSITATAELVVPRSMPIMGPLTFSPASFTFSVVAHLRCNPIGALYADDLKVGAARGTACAEVSDCSCDASRRFHLRSASVVMTACSRKV